MHNSEFSHPFSRDYLKILIQKSVKQLMNSQIIKQDKWVEKQ